MRKTLIITAALLLPATALAQDKSATPDLRLTKDQTAKIQQINARYDAQIKAAFAGEDKMVSAMQSDLKQIDAEKDAGKKKAAIAAYQARYAKSYKATLAKGKVNLNSWASDLRSVMPGFTFVVPDGMYVLATAEPSTPDTPAAAPTSKTTTETIAASDFSFERKSGCGPVGGNTVTRSGGGVSTETWAAELAGCRNEGVLSRTIPQFPGSTKVKVDMKADLNVDVLATGVLGIAHSTGYSVISIDFEWGGTAAAKSHFCSVFAPFLWAAWDDCGKNGETISKELEPYGPYTIVARTETSATAGGIVAVTTASSSVRNLSTKITRTTP